MNKKYKLKEPKYFKDFGWFVGIEDNYNPTENEDIEDIDGCGYLWDNGEIYPYATDNNGNPRGYFKTKELANQARDKYLKENKISSQIKEITRTVFTVKGRDFNTKEKAEKWLTSKMWEELLSNCYGDSYKEEQESLVDILTILIDNGYTTKDKLIELKRMINA